MGLINVISCDKDGGVVKKSSNSCDVIIYMYGPKGADNEIY